MTDHTHDWRCTICGTYSAEAVASLTSQLAAERARTFNALEEREQERSEKAALVDLTDAHFRTYGFDEGDKPLQHLLATLAPAAARDADPGYGPDACPACYGTGCPVCSEPTIKESSDAD